MAQLTSVTVYSAYYRQTLPMSKTIDRRRGQGSHGSRHDATSAESNGRILAIQLLCKLNVTTMMSQSSIFALNKISNKEVKRSKEVLTRVF